MIIIPAGDETTEAEMTLAVLAYLPTCAYGEASMDRLTFDLPNRYIALTVHDREMSRSRRTEQKWITILRNIGAHEKQPGNAVHDGVLVKRRGGGYQLASRVKKQA